MATFREIIELVDENEPNAFSEKQKFLWLSNLDGKIMADIFLVDIADIRTLQYNYPADLDRELMVKYPHDDIYEAWLSAMIDHENGEYNKYQNTMQLYNSRLSQFSRWFARTYAPAQGSYVHRPEGPTYYLTAYGLAQSMGFAGTLEEWLESIAGPAGPAGPEGPAGPVGPPGDFSTHGQLPGRDEVDQHPMSAISGLIPALSQKADASLLAQKVDTDTLIDALALKVDISAFNTALAGKIDKAGGTFTGEVFFDKGVSMAPIATALPDAFSYIRLCTIKIVNTYSTSPVYIYISSRSGTSVTKIKFKAINSLDPDIEYMQTIGVHTVSIFKSATSTWRIQVSVTANERIVVRHLDYAGADLQFDFSVDSATYRADGTIYGSKSSFFSNPIILQSGIHYGSTHPSNPVEGQFFLKIPTAAASSDEQVSDSEVTVSGDTE